MIYKQICLLVCLFLVLKNRMLLTFVVETIFLNAC